MLPRASCLVLIASGLALWTGGAADSVPSPRGRAGADWPTFLGPTRDGRSAETGLRTDWPSDGPPLVWAVATGEGYAGPTISGGRLFLFDRRGDLARLTALESTTGHELWRAEYPMAYEDYYGYSNGPRASPVVDGERVYTFGVEGRLRCHRATDGALLWDVDTTRRYGVVQNFFGVGSTPVIEDDLLIVPVGGSPPGSPKIHSGRVRGNGSGLVAFDKLTGEEVYRISDELASYASPVVATIGGRRWGFAFQRGGLVAFEPGSGRIDFSFPWRSTRLESVNASTPVVVGDTVFLSESYGPGSVLLRVRPEGPEVIWRDARRGKAIETHWSTAIHHEGFLYASSGQSTGNAELRCVEHATGTVRWSQPGLTRSTLLYADGYLLALGEYGVLRLVEATPAAYRPIAEVDLRDVRGPVVQPDGTLRTQSLLGFPSWNAPVLSHGLLYLHGKETLIALELIPAG